MFIFSVLSKVIIIVIEFMFLGINIFWALLRAHLNPPLTARANLSLSWAQNIPMPTKINSIVLLLSDHITVLKSEEHGSGVLLVQEKYLFLSFQQSVVSLDRVSS